MSSRFDWMDDAACKGEDPTEWFPESVTALRRSEATRVCKTCPVQIQCATFAAQTGASFGIWGGNSKKMGRPTRA